MPKKVTHNDITQRPIFSSYILRYKALMNEVIFGIVITDGLLQELEILSPGKFVMVAQLENDTS